MDIIAFSIVFHCFYIKKISTCALQPHTSSHCACSDSRPQRACAVAQIDLSLLQKTQSRLLGKCCNVLNKSPSSRKFYFEFVQNQLLDILNWTITVLPCNWSCGHDISAILCRFSGKWPVTFFGKDERWNLFVCYVQPCVATWRQSFVAQILLRTWK